MPPSRPRQPLDDSRSESSSVQTSKEKHGAINSSSTGISKGKRMVNPIVSISSPAIGPSIPSAANGNAVLDVEAPRISWTSFDLPALHSYRQSYRLPTSSAFANPHAQHMLSFGIGARSPSSVAARRAERSSRRGSKSNGTNGAGITKTSNGPDRIVAKISKDQLANNVRKHFNNLAVSEGEVLARFRYMVRMGGLAETAFTPREGNGLGGLAVGGGERDFRLRFHPYL